MNQTGPESKRPPEPPRSENPRRVRGGLKLKNKEGPRSTNWVARRWLSLIESAFGPDARDEGLAYVRSGQVASLKIESGTIDARVQGRAARAYTTRLAVEPFTSAQWERLISEMAGGAIYVARLMARELPSSLADLLDSAAIELLPANPAALAMTCSCKEPKPCKHAAAAGLIVADQLSDDPTLALSLYGMPVEAVLDRLRQVRAMHTHGVASTYADPMIPESQIEPPPLEACLDEFWRPGPQLAELEQAPPPQHIAHALLRRLGPSPMQGRFPLVGLLASVYDTVSQEAIRIRDRAEHIDSADHQHQDASADQAATEP